MCKPHITQISWKQHPLTSQIPSPENHPTTTPPQNNSWLGSFWWLLFFLVLLVLLLLLVFLLLLVTGAWPKQVGHYGKQVGQMDGSNQFHQQCIPIAWCIQGYNKRKWNVEFMHTISMQCQCHCNAPRLTNTNPSAMSTSLVPKKLDGVAKLAWCIATCTIQPSIEGEEDLE